MMTTLFILGGLSAVAMVAGAVPVQSDDQAVRAVVTAFAEAADRRDVAGVRAAMAAEARQVMLREGQLVSLDLEPYAQLMAAGKVGGAPRAVTIHRVEVTGNQALVTADFTGAAAAFHNQILLLRLQEGWRIAGLSVQVTVAPQPPPVR